jgi:TetR/AcrR family transcriptional regulator
MNPTSTLPHTHEARERILGAAAEVFAEHGFAGAGVDEIARRAGVNKAMLYYHVGDKAALHAAVLIGYLQQLRETVEAADATSHEPTQRLRAVISAFYAVFTESPPFPQIMMRELASGGTSLPPDALHVMGDIMRLTRRILENGRTAGAFRDVNPVLAHLLIVGSAFFLTNAQRMRPRVGELNLPADAIPEPQDVAGTLADLILDGITKRNTLGGGR